MCSARACGAAVGGIRAAQGRAWAWAWACAAPRLVEQLGCREVGLALVLQQVARYAQRRVQARAREGLAAHLCRCATCSVGVWGSSLEGRGRAARSREGARTRHPHWFTSAFSSRVRTPGVGASEAARIRKCRCSSCAPRSCEIIHSASPSQCRLSRSAMGWRCSGFTSAPSAAWTVMEW